MNPLRLFVILSVLVFFFGCAQTGARNEPAASNDSGIDDELGKQYSLGQLTFKCPDGWESESVSKRKAIRSEYLNSTKVTCSRDGYGTIAVDSMIFDEAPDDVLGAYYGDYKAPKEVLFAEFSAKPETKSGINGIEARKIEFSYFNANPATERGEDISGELFVLPCGNAWIAIMRTSVASEASGNLQAFSDLASTVVCKGGADAATTPEPAAETQPPEVSPANESQENESTGLGFEKLKALGCWEFGDVDDLEEPGYILYTAGYAPIAQTEGFELARWDDYCAAKDAVMRAYCPIPPKGAIASYARTPCPDGMLCLEGACMTQNEYDAAVKCRDVSRGDGSLRLCENYTLIHDSGVQLTPDLEYAAGNYDLTMQVEGADKTTLGDGDFKEQELIADSGKRIFVKVFTYDKESVAFNIRTEGGIDPAETEGGEIVLGVGSYTQ